MEKFLIVKHWNSFLNDNMYVAVTNQDNYKAFLQLCEEQKLLWESTEKPTNKNYLSGSPSIAIRCIPRRKQLNYNNHVDENCYEYTK